MRIRYKYKKYNTSERATALSETSSMILATFSTIIGIGNFFGFFGLGASFYEMLEGKSDFNNTLLMFGCAALISLADFVIIYIYFVINCICERMAIKDDKSLTPEQKSLFLKENKTEYFDCIRYLFPRFCICLPLVLIAICAISSFIYGLLNSELLCLVMGALIIGIVVFLLFVIKRKLL